MFCEKCGKELKESQKFCAACGTQVERANVEKTEQMLQTNSETQNPRQAGNGLKVWLIVTIVLSVIACFFGIKAMFYYADLGEILGQAATNLSLLMLLSVVVNIVYIVGMVQLLKGYKLGFYIMCACWVLAFVIAIVHKQWINMIVCWVSPCVTWYLAKSKWESFI